MKKLPITAILVVLVLLAVSPALAHPPEAIKLSIDSSSVLTVNVKHTVKQSATDHYIAKITVELNGNHIVSQAFRSQTDSDGQDVYYVVIDAKPDDKISVTAECSIFGNLKVELTVPPGTGQ